MLYYSNLSEEITDFTPSEINEENTYNLNLRKMIFLFIM